MQAVSRLFRLRGAGRDAMPSPALLGDLDSVLATALAGHGSDSRAAITALVGLRRALFPAAPAALSPVPAGAPA
jgi:hypothetical protein